MKKKIEAFGKTCKGDAAKLITFTNKNGMSVSFTDYGATIVNICVPDRKGQLADVCLGFSDAKGYDNNSNNLGAFVGRCANRIGGAKVTIGGKTYKLQVNDKGENTLHSGTPTYFNKMMEYDIYSNDSESISVEFSGYSPDLEQGFPGNLDYTVTYTLTEDNELIIEYFAVSDKETMVNFTNHSYFNLAGHNSGTTYEQYVQIDSDAFTPTDDKLIPTGEIRSVEGTPLDFRKAKKIGQDINADYESLKQANGFDQNYVLKTSRDEAKKVAEMYDEASGRLMEVYTDLPGLQFYAGNFLSSDEGKGKGGCTYHPRDGVCFESQFAPNAINIPAFNFKTIQPDEEFNSITVYKFLVK